MSEIDAANHVIYALRNAQVKKWPFPHFFIEKVFPDNFYYSLTRRLRSRSDFSTQGELYNGRTFAKSVDFPELDFMKTREFLSHVAHIFYAEMNKRFEGKNAPVYTDLRLIRDGRGYFIGPHTDATWKLISLLFYLPDDTWHHQHGTSLYIPKDPAARCPGGPHHDFQHFHRVHTVPYLPNSCLGFFKTDYSFHGVEPIHEDIRRDVLLYNVYDEELYLRTHKTPAPEPS